MARKVGQSSGASKQIVPLGALNPQKDEAALKDGDPFPKGSFDYWI